MKRLFQCIISFFMIVVFLGGLTSCTRVDHKTDDEISISLPWENGGKQPDEYTWDEFQELDGMRQEAFVESFDTLEAFEIWEDKNEPKENQVYPWESGERELLDYTWEEFSELSGIAQENFVESFESSEAFRAWEKNAKSAE